MAADARRLGVGPGDHDGRVPPHEGPDATLHGLVAREPRLALGRDGVDVVAGHGGREPDLELAGPLEQLHHEEPGPGLAPDVDHRVERVHPLGRLLGIDVGDLGGESVEDHRDLVSPVSRLIRANYTHEGVSARTVRRASHPRNRLIRAITRMRGRAREVFGGTARCRTRPIQCPSMSDTELAALAELQEGLVTRPQARVHLTRKQLEHWLATGRLTVVRWGIYRFAGVPATRWQPLRAALLAAGSDALASHSLGRRGLGNAGGDRRPARAHRPVAACGPGFPASRSHQSRYLLDHHRAVHQGVPVTSPARTLGDLSGVVGAQLLGRLVDDSLRRHLLLLDDLREVYDVLASRGRRRLTVLRAVLEDSAARLPPRRTVRRSSTCGGSWSTPASASRSPVPGRRRVDRVPPRLGVSRRSDRDRVQRLGAPRRRSAIDHDAARYAAR